ncbi:MAG: zinc ribbon domain-containing protein [Flavobacteriaceae bacterium]|tara:strand:+ start:591 stop:1367 length:777 start_codon:yes stop_codon:yes gene_type:complete
MAKKKEPTVEKKLRALYDLQLIDSRIDEIVSLRGELPLEVDDLENEIKDLKAKSEKINAVIEENKKEILAQKQIIENAKELHKKYEEKLKNVRNNREYNSIVKEQEYQDLESQLAEKKINEFKSNIEQKELSLEEIMQKIEDRSKHLDSKKSELETILKETHKEENLLQKKSAEFEKDIEEVLINSYKRIRSSVKNGLAIVSIERGASGGSYFSIPPQVQLEIASRNKIITDEHSGRILVDAELAKEEREKIDKLIGN